MTDPTEDDAAESGLECQKHRIRICASQARCADPELYCKFRPACLIHFLEKENARRRRPSSGEDS